MHIKVKYTSVNMLNKVTFPILLFLFYNFWVDPPGTLVHPSWGACAIENPLTLLATQPQNDLQF